MWILCRFNKQLMCYLVSVRGAARQIQLLLDRARQGASSFPGAGRRLIFTTRGIDLFTSCFDKKANERISQNDELQYRFI